MILKTIKGRRRGSRDVRERFKRSASLPPSTDPPTTSMNRYFESKIVSPGNLVKTGLAMAATWWTQLFNDLCENDCWDKLLRAWLFNAGLINTGLERIWFQVWKLKLKQIQFYSFCIQFDDWMPWEEENYWGKCFWTKEKPEIKI